MTLHFEQELVRLAHFQRTMSERAAFGLLANNRRRTGCWPSIWSALGQHGS